MKFERATKADKVEILALYRSLIGTEFCAWDEHYPSEVEFDNDLSRDAIFCLRDKDGEIIGVISIDDDKEVDQLSCWSKELKPAAELSRLGVRVESQNQGIARQLLQYGMEELKKRGNKAVHFLVSKTNEKAIRSYDKLKFDTVGECNMFGVDWWCYERALQTFLLTS